jgi:hypothetical protein
MISASCLGGNWITIRASSQTSNPSYSECGFALFEHLEGFGDGLIVRQTGHLFDRFDMSAALEKAAHDGFPRSSR